MGPGDRKAFLAQVAHDGGDNISVLAANASALACVRIEPCDCDARRLDPNWLRKPST